MSFGQELSASSPGSPALGTMGFLRLCDHEQSPCKRSPAMCLSVLLARLPWRTWLEREQSQTVSAVSEDAHRGPVSTQGLQSDGIAPSSAG